MINIIIYICILALWFVELYFSTISKMKEYAQHAINEAEKVKESGDVKMELAIKQVRKAIPFFLKFAFSNKNIKDIIQAVFDKMEEYANMQKGGDTDGSR